MESPATLGDHPCGEPTGVPVGPASQWLGRGRRVLGLKLLGEIEIVRDGERIALPPSRKTRALLAYLAATAKPHRRDRLCAVFWDVPDDPRGALRWSLSRLRGLVDEPGAQRIAATRESVSFEPLGADVDLLSIAQTRCGRTSRDLAC